MKDLYDHPIFNTVNFQINTRAINTLEETLLRWLWTGATGGMVAGKTRHGKTKAMKIVLQKLCTRKKFKYPSLNLTVPPRDFKTIASLYRGLCRSENLKYSDRATSDKLMDLYINHILDLVTITKNQHVIQVVDEMQRLNSNQINVFAEIYDTLVDAGILYTVIFIGNEPYCWEVIEGLEEENKGPIYGRFFTQNHPFKGIDSKDDVEFCLKQYDILRYPNDGPTYVEWFLKNNDKEFASLAPLLWSNFTEYKKKYHFKSWGMQYFTLTVRTLLVDFLPRYGFEGITNSMVKECIEISGLIGSAVRMD